MKLAIASLLARYATALSPVQAGKASTDINASKCYIGYQEPLGFFGPNGMLAYADQERFDCLRCVKINRGRIERLAFLVQITTSNGINLLGDIDYYLTPLLPSPMD